MSLSPLRRPTTARSLWKPGNNSQRLAKLMENPEGYDIVYFSDYYVKEAIAADLFLPIEADKIEGLTDLYDFCQDPNNGYGPGYTVTGFGILYDPAMVDEPITSWKRCGTRGIAASWPCRTSPLLPAPT